MAHIIAINGSSSCGKSTFAAELAKHLPNAIHISGDLLMFSSFLRNEHNVMKLCGRTFSSIEDFFDYYFHNETHELLSSIVFDPALDSNFFTDVSNVIKEDPSLEYVIVEWSLCNYIHSIWDSAAVTLTMKATSEIQLRNFQKHIQERDDRIESLRMRDSISDPLICDGKYVVSNDGTDSFYQRAGQIAEEILQLTRVQE